MVTALWVLWEELTRQNGTTTIQKKKKRQEQRMRKSKHTSGCKSCCLARMGLVRRRMGETERLAAPRLQER